MRQFETPAVSGAAPRFHSDDRAVSQQNNIAIKRYRKIR